MKNKKPNYLNLFQPSSHQYFEQPKKMALKKDSNLEKAGLNLEKLIVQQYTRQINKQLENKEKLKKAAQIINTLLNK